MSHLVIGMLVGFGVVLIGVGIANWTPGRPRKNRIDGWWHATWVNRFDDRVPAPPSKRTPEAWARACAESTAKAKARR